MAKGHIHIVGWFTGCMWKNSEWFTQKVKFTLEQDMKAQRGSRSMAVLFL